MMDFLGGIATTLGAAASGGLTGLIGLVIRQGAEWLNRREDRLMRAQQNAHDIAVIDANVRLMDKEWEHRAKVATIEGETAAETAASAAFAASFSTEPQRYAEGVRPKGWFGKAGWFLMILVDLVKGLIRPGLTLYLVVLTTMLWVQLQALMNRYGMSLSSAEVMGLSKMIIDTVLYLTVTCVTWWFGVRPNSKAPGRA